MDMSAEKQRELTQVHRAIGDHDEDAWQTVYTTYNDYLLHWIGRTDSASRLCQQEREDLVHVAIAKFYQACVTTGKTAADFQDLARVYAYLRLCAKSVTLDALTRRLDTSSDLSWTYGTPDDPVAMIIEAEAAQELVQFVRSEVRTEQERILVACWLQQIPPREIVRHFAATFADLQAVYTTQHTFRNRLTYRLAQQRSVPGVLEPQLHTEPVPTIQAPREKNQPATHSIQHRPTLASVTPTESLCCATTGNVGDADEKERIEPPEASTERVFVTGMSNIMSQGCRSSVWTMQEPSEQCQSATPLSSPTTITYHQQIANCGKARCRKCREGIGHGPYWYAYHVCNGRSIRQYIGKSLPADVRNMFATQL